MLRARKVAARETFGFVALERRCALADALQRILADLDALASVPRS